MTGTSLQLHDGRRFAVTVAYSLLLLTCSACHGDASQEERIKMLVSKINDDTGKGGKLHLTPAVEELIDIGMPSLPAVLPLMLADDSATRERAQAVLSQVTAKRFGWVSGNGWPSEEANEKHREFWKSLGDLDWDANREAREKSIKLWRAWLNSMRLA